MEFRRVAALIAITIFSISVLCMIVSTGYSYYKWNKTLDEMMHQKDLASPERLVDCSMENTSIGVLNPSFQVEENTSLAKMLHKHTSNHKKLVKTKIKGHDCCSGVKTPLPRKLSSVKTSSNGLSSDFKEKIIQAVTRKRNLSMSDGSKSLDGSFNASTLV